MKNPGRRKILAFSALPLFLVFFAPFSPAKEDAVLKEVRAAVLNPASSASDTVLKYSEFSGKAADPAVTGEYAYILGYYGLAEEALYHIDRALIAGPYDCRVRFYLSGLLSAFGVPAGAEISGCLPAWLKEPLKLPALEIKPGLAGPEELFDRTGLLMAQKRYAEAAVLFAANCGKEADNRRCYGGYAIALEKLGAYKAAAAAVEKDISLSSGEEHKKPAETYKEELLARPSPVYGEGSPKKRLKGRYLAYLGGSVTHFGSSTLYNLNSRAGKFITEKLDVSADFGWSGGNEDPDYNGFTLGLTARGNASLGHSAFSVTLAGKAERIPAPEDNFSFIISPGLSYFTGGGSVDVYLDLPLSGAYEGSPVVSAGYTVYF